MKRRLAAQGPGLRGVVAPASPPPPGYGGPTEARAKAGVPAIVAAVWLAGAVVTWNMVFDAHIVKGARDYVDAQQLFSEGRGPRQDMERAMTAARSAGLRSAFFWAGVELAPGAAAVLWISGRRRLGRPASARAASR